MSALVRTYRTESQQLHHKEVLHEGILRVAKSNEENYMLYLRKQEEARISDALDSSAFPTWWLPNRNSPFAPKDDGCLQCFSVGSLQAWRA